MSIFGSGVTWLVLLGLAVVCTLYAFLYVRPLREDDPEHGQTAMLVVIGDGAVALAVVLIVAAHGAVDALGLAAVLVACLVAGGLPMIFEYINWHTGQRVALRASQERGQVLTQVAQIFEE